MYFERETKKQEVRGKRAKAKSSRSVKVSSTKDKVTCVSSNKEGNRDRASTCSKTLSCDQSRSQASTTSKSISGGKTEKTKPKKSSLEKAKSQKFIEKAQTGFQTPSVRNDRRDPKKISYREEKARSVCMALRSRRVKLYCLFLDHIIPLFNKHNLILQQEEPMIHNCRENMLELFKQLLLRFVKPTEISQAKELTDIDYHDCKKQKSDDTLTVGSKTRKYMAESKLYESSLCEFYKDVRNYYTTVCDYIVKRFPLNNELLKHSAVADVTKRMMIDFSSVMYFPSRFVCMEPKETNWQDNLEAEFLNYQVPVDELNPEILNTEKVDKQWNLISKLKDANGQLKYKLLSSIMKNVLIVPHSNAGCERVFSFVAKKHSKSRSSVLVDTLEAILVMKEKGGDLLQYGV